MQSRNTENLTQDIAGLLDPCLMKQLASSSNPAGRVPTVEPLRHVLQSTSSCRWEATGANPQGTEDSNGPAVSQLLLEPGRAVTHGDETTTCDIYSQLHTPSFGPTPGPEVSEPPTAHLPGQVFSPKVSSELCCPPAFPHSDLGEDWVL